MTAVLQEIHLDPCRDEHAVRNHLVDVNFEPVYVTKHDRPGEKFLWVATKEHGEEIAGIIVAMGRGFYPDEVKRQYDINFMKIQSEFLSGRSLLDACMAGKKEVWGCFHPSLAENQATLFVRLESDDSLFSELYAVAQQHVAEYPADQPLLESIEKRLFSKALRQACSYAHTTPNLIKSLLDYLRTAEKPLKESVNEVSTNGRTPLHWAAIAAVTNEHHDEIIRLLRDAGANTLAEDRLGSTYLNYLDKARESQVHQSVSRGSSG